MQHRVERHVPSERYKQANGRRRVQPWRLTISLIQLGANGEVQPFETG